MHERKHTDGIVESIMWILLEIYLSLKQWNNFENPLRIDKVIAMSLVYYFFETQYMHLMHILCLKKVVFASYTNIWMVWPSDRSY